MARCADFEKLYKVTGYRFRNEKFLKTALTHSSYASEQKLGYERNNERLEFIGDAYVDAVVGAELFDIMGTAHEGMLSRCRADVVCEDSLAKAAADMGLGEFLYLGRGEESSGGRAKASILADAFEALVGAIILDGGFEEGKKVTEPHGVNIIDMHVVRLQLVLHVDIHNDRGDHHGSLNCIKILLADCREYRCIIVHLQTID